MANAAPGPGDDSNLIGEREVHKRHRLREERSHCKTRRTQTPETNISRRSREFVGIIRAFNMKNIVLPAVAAAVVVAFVPFVDAAPPAPAASPAPAAAVTAAPSQTPAPNTPQGKQLIEGRQAIIAAYSPLAQKYSEAHAAMQAAGGVSPAGFTSKEAIAARKALIDACIAANDDMLKFLATEPDILRTELAKVSMTPPQIDQYVANFTPDPATPQLVQIRTLARKTFESMEESLAVLDESYGRWKLGEGGHIQFKKQADAKKYGAAVDGINKAINAQTAAQQQLKANDLERAPAPAS